MRYDSDCECGLQSLVKNELVSEGLFFMNLVFALPFMSYEGQEECESNTDIQTVVAVLRI